MNPKNRLASAGERGMKPTSSTTTRAALRRHLRRRLLALEISAVLEDGHEAVQGFDPHFWLGGIGPQGDGIAVAVVDNRVVLAHRPADHRALHPDHRTAGAAGTAAPHSVHSRVGARIRLYPSWPDSLSSTFWTSFPRLFCFLSHISCFIIKSLFWTLPLTAPAA